MPIAPADKIKHLKDMSVYKSCLSCGNIMVGIISHNERDICSGCGGISRLELTNPNKE